MPEEALDKGGLRRVSSFVMDLTFTPSKGGLGGSGRKRVIKVGKRVLVRNDSRDEIVPDSEEERAALSDEKSGKGEDSGDKKKVDVIEISSESESEKVVFTSRRKVSPHVDHPAVVLPGGWPAEHRRLLNTPRKPASKNPVRHHDSQDTIQSATTHVSDSEPGSQDISTKDRRDVIELTDSEPEPVSPKRRPKPKPRFKSARPDAEVETPRVFMPLFQDGDETSEADYESSDVDAGAILTLNEPKSARTPIRRGHGVSVGKIATGSRSVPPKVKRPLISHTVSEDYEISEGDDGAILTLNEPKSARTPIRRGHGVSVGKVVMGSISVPPKSKRPVISDVVSESSDEDVVSETPSRSRAPATPSKTPKPPRTPKKAHAAAAEQARREAYAEELFADLNRVVFKDELPKDTKLVWSKRLLMTAGKAKWHRGVSREGVNTTKIELAAKILDSDERIRNTLSHEMCHLACWIINRDARENHGMVWRAWTDKVMRARPEIKISTKHDYEITYPYEWRCEQCAKIYGRFSNSIRPDDSFCGACKKGTLVPLFTTRKRVAKAPPSNAASPMAAEKVRDSPIRTSLVVDSAVSKPIHGSLRDHNCITVHGDTSDSDIENLATGLGAVSIASAMEL